MCNMKCLCVRASRLNVIHGAACRFRPAGRAGGVRRVSSGRWQCGQHSVLVRGGGSGNAFDVRVEMEVRKHYACLSAAMSTH